MSFFKNQLIFLQIHRLFKKKSRDNFTWLLYDKILRGGAGFVISIIVARYLGPNNFGILNFLLAIVAIFYIFSSLGLNPIIVKKIVETPGKTIKILNTSLILKLTAGIFSYFFFLLTIAIIRPENSSFFLYSLIIGFTLILKSSEIFFCYFESKLLSKFIVLSQSFGLFILIIFQLILVLKKLPLIYFFWSYLIEVAVTTLLIMFFYFNKNAIFNLFKFNFSLSKNLLRKSWPILFSGIGIIIYMRIDQIMLGQMLNSEAVGVYSAAIKLSEIWHFIPKITLISVTPILISLHKKNKLSFKKEFKKILKIMIFLSILISFFIFVFSKSIIGILYGSEFYESIDVLKINIWSLIFVSMGVISSQWYIIKNKQHFSLYYVLLGAIANIILNYFLIPLYGANGAAISTLISYSMIILIFDLLAKETREIFYLKISVFLPLKMTK